MPRGIKSPSVCSIDNDECSAPGGSISRGWCETHYRRWLKHGDAITPRPYGPPKKATVCSVEECVSASEMTRGLCRMHYARWQRHGDPLVVLPFGIFGKIGPDHPNWKGDDVGISAVHERLRTQRGSASDYPCPCGRQARDWSYSNICPDEKQSKLGPYCVHFECYEPLCSSCHKIKDLNRPHLVAVG
jgi:hypothetical protein